MEISKEIFHTFVLTKLLVKIISNIKCQNLP